VKEARKTTAFKDRTGTLRRSLAIIPGLRKSQDVFVGPLRGTQYIMQRRDGYYAQMVFGSGVEFRRRVLEPAILTASPAALSKIKVEVDKILTKAKQQYIKR
jgi:hypothetical protein